MDEALISIGQFASLTWLSPKALRLYQSQGLLDAAEIDPNSGYRYYAPSQIPIARRIALLRRAGVSLAEIAAFLESPTKDQIDQWQRDLDAEVAERHQLLDHVARTLHSTEVTPLPTDPSQAQLQRAVPVLASLDIEATQRFYADKLGFTAVARYPDYGIVERNNVQIHFWLTDDADIPKATSCRVDVDGVDQLYEEMNASGVVHPNGPLTDQPWGLREFAVLDGDGNMIKFGQRTAP
ncbi:MAG TPA: glyoxalase superfamily protein [Acidimicrobiales bacterium]|nr:glyoxalase superfamily protein [Acidimicrobiales bacterium]